ncbi:hypothetical protein JQC92_12630 [Shewanella sp. 202IG2-18]|uniref:hypothetical protein n=1 Tax=Parashewanella hymeniacidonis TaxID=2807618 RepID=UPI0019605F6D|nr:hypothetical protein [Parashewanella hymeniacidonis]MBM7072867.1 hypothetical protein [Parashewanella hymeniacidonis]
MAVVETPLSIAQNTEIASAIEGIDFKHFLQGRTCTLKFRKTSGEKVTYEVTIQKDFIDAREKSILPRFLIDCEGSNKPSKDSSTASQVLDHLYQCKKLSTEGFIKLILLPGYLNERSLGALRNVNGKTVTELVTLTVNLGNKCERNDRVLTQALFACQPNLVAKELEKKSDDELTQLFKREEWVSQEQKVEILFALPQEQRGNFLKSLKQNELFEVFGLGDKISRVTSVKLLNHIFEFCEQQQDNTLIECLKLLNDTQIIVFLYSRPPKKILEIISQLPPQTFCTFIKAVLNDTTLSSYLFIDPTDEDNLNFESEKKNRTEFLAEVCEFVAQNQSNCLVEKLITSLLQEETETLLKFCSEAFIADSSTQILWKLNLLSFR